MNILQRFIRRRIAHHDARAKVFAAAAVAAQTSGDTRNAVDFHQQMLRAQRTRDDLRAKHPECCNHDCDEGRLCPRRA